MCNHLCFSNKFNFFFIVFYLLLTNNLFSQNYNQIDSSLFSSSLYKKGSILLGAITKMGINNDRFNKYNIINLYLSPRIGYFLYDRLVLGVGIKNQAQFVDINKDKSFKLIYYVIDFNTFLRFYFNSGFYSELSYTPNLLFMTQYATYNWYIITDISSIITRIGYSYEINNKLTVEPVLQHEISFIKTNDIIKNALSISSIDIFIGIHYYFTSSKYKQQKKKVQTVS